MKKILDNVPDQDQDLTQYFQLLQDKLLGRSFSRLKCYQRGYLVKEHKEHFLGNLKCNIGLSGVMERKKQELWQTVRKQ